MALSFVDSATSSTGATITAPNSIQRGDLLVLLQRGPYPDVAPSGFTNIGSANLSTTYSTSAYYKIATGQENGSIITGISNGSKALLVFRGSGPLTVTPADYEGQITSANPTAQTINASGQSTPLVALAMYDVAIGTTDPRTFTVGGSDASDAEITSDSQQFYVKYKIYNSSPADITVDMDDEGTGNSLQSFYITCTEGSFNSGLDFLASREESVAGTDASTLIPTVRANGDLLVCLEAARDSAANPTDSTPSNWTKIGTAVSTGTVYTRTSAFYKISDGTETTVGALSAATFTKRQVLVFRRFDGAINSVTAASYAGDCTNGNPAAQTITSASGTAPLVVIGMAASNTAVDPLTFTVGGVATGDRTIGVLGTDTIISKHKIYASSPADLVADMDDEGLYNALQSFYLSPKIPVTTTKSFSASVTASSALSRVATRPRTYSLSVTPSAAITKISVRPKSFSASVTPSASFSRLATRLKTLTASVTPSVSLSRPSTRLKSFSASVTASAAMTKIATVYKTFTTSLTPSVVFARAHVVPVGLAIESDSALVTTKRRAYAIALAQETDSAFAVGSLHLYAVGLAQETDSAFDVTVDAGVTLGLALESDEALAVASSKTKAVNQAQETDSAFAASVFQLKIINVGQAVETDEGFAVIGIKARMVGQAIENDSAFPLQGLKYARRLFFVGRGPEEKRRVPNEFHIFKSNPN